jgi:hypothetical protein
MREIPYNYTSFSDREIVIRLLGERAWDLLNRLRDERRTGRSARMLYEVLGDVWVVQRNPYLQDDLLDNPKRRKPAGRRPAAPPDRGGEAPHARRRPAARRHRGRVAGSRPRAVVRFDASFSETYDLRRLTARKLRKLHPRTTSSSTAFRASRTSPTRPTGASSTRSWCSRPTPKPKWPAWSRPASSWA